MLCLFARLFLQQPSWIFIEEATDAFDENSENAIMEMLHRELPNATVITISMHAGMEKHHQRSIVLSRIKDEKYLFSDDRQCLLPVRREDVHADAEVLLTPVLRRKSDPK